MLEQLTSFLTAPLQYEFMYNAMIALTLIGAICGLVSTFLVLKGWSLYGDALSHAVLPGIILAIMFGIPTGIGILTLALIVTFSIQYFRKKTVYTEQTVLSFVTSSYMGMGFLLYYTFPPNIRLNEVLFGKVVGITTPDLYLLAILTVFLIALVALFWRTLSLVFFDRILAQIIGIRVWFYEFLFYLLIGISVMSSLRTVGSLLIVSMLIIPGTVGYILSKSLKTIFIIATVFSISTSIIGLYISYYCHAVAGATIISLQFISFIVIFFVQYLSRRWLLSKAAHRLEEEHQAYKQAKLREATQGVNNISGEGKC